jgi:hypothetical protein
MGNEKEGMATREKVTLDELPELSMDGRDSAKEICHTKTTEEEEGERKLDKGRIMGGKEGFSG